MPNGSYVMIIFFHEKIKHALNNAKWFICYDEFLS